jgi:hypothetical protein
MVRYRFTHFLIQYAPSRREGINEFVKCGQRIPRCRMTNPLRTLSVQMCNIY